MNDREKFLASANEEREALAKIFDKANAAYKKGIATFSDFLSEREYSEFKARQKHVDSVKVTAFGGYDGAMRVMLRFSEGEEAFPIQAVKVCSRSIEGLKHPDLLGSIMSLGIERKGVGDIIKSDGCWYVFCSESIAEYIAENLCEAGGVSTSCTLCEIGDINVTNHFEMITGTVASLRADAVVSVMLKTSRTKAGEYIAAQRFYLNQALCTKCDKEIKENDILNVRGHGKAVLAEISGKSKKGRIFINIKKYI